MQICRRSLVGCSVFSCCTLSGNCVATALSRACLYVELILALTLTQFGHRLPMSSSSNPTHEQLLLSSHCVVHSIIRFFSSRLGFNLIDFLSLFHTLARRCSLGLCFLTLKSVYNVRTSFALNDFIRFIRHVFRCA